MNRLTYSQARRFVFSREFFGMKLGLENIIEYLGQLGNPQLKYKTVHIAGTNGKGSTAAMIASIFQEQGYKTGLYTSPHLVDFRERIQINGENITAQAVASFISSEKKVLQKRKLTFFEVVTALAFDYFAGQKIDVAVIETGLGGRLDATNVLLPSLTITTDIDFDHTEILGGTIRKISYEKAGIIKSGTPHLIGLLPSQAAEVFLKTCRELKAPFHKLDRSEINLDRKNMSLDFADNGFRFSKVTPALYGPHQLNNTALVLKATSIFRNNGLYVSNEAIENGIRKTEWPGRFQVLKSTDGPTIVLDVAHNPGGIRAFVESFRARFPKQKGRLIVGFVQKKNYQGIFDNLSEIAREYALTPLKTKRSADTKKLLRQVDFKGIPGQKFGSLSGAFQYVTKKGTSDDIIGVVGSHYLVGEFLEKFGAKWVGRPDKKKIPKKRQIQRSRPLPARLNY